MKNISLIIIITMMLSGCGNNNELNEVVELVEEDQSLVAQIPQTNEGQMSQAIESVTINGNDFNNPVMQNQNLVVQSHEPAIIYSNEFNNLKVQNQNIIVQNPQTNFVTFEIDERLVGRYIAGKLMERDIATGAFVEGEEIFFEIKPDARAEITLETFAGSAHYGSEDIQLTAYYTDEKVIINFNLISGNWTFPANCGLSLCFEGDSNFTTFISTADISEYEMKFVRQN